MQRDWEGEKGHQGNRFSSDGALPRKFEGEGESLPVCFSKSQLWHQLAEKAGFTVWLNMYVSVLYGLICMCLCCMA